MLDNEDYIRFSRALRPFQQRVLSVVRSDIRSLEGAQKLKEISYIHAEAYPASELKHGPLALVTEETPTVVVLPADGLLDKAVGSIEEIRARGGPVIAVGSHDARIEALASAYIRTPEVLAELSPAVIGVVLQLLAYHAAVHLERDIDHRATSPRASRSSDVSGASRGSYNTATPEAIIRAVPNQTMEVGVSFHKT